MPLRDDVLALLRTDPAFREELRRQLLTEELLGLPALFRELAERVGQLAEAQRRTDEHLDALTARVDALTARVEQLAEAQRRTEERLQQLIERVDVLSTEMRELVTWQRGEAGRRDGERFERRVVAQALTLFNGGSGGAPGDYPVRDRLADPLRARLADGTPVSPEDDPLLADLVWWKGGQIIVVEASLQVDANDVARAASRAATLGRGGTHALGVVVGEEWATPGTARQAEALGVEWKVGTDLSAGFMALRRRAA